jgi:hypothetical protein
MRKSTKLKNVGIHQAYQHLMAVPEEDRKGQYLKKKMHKPLPNLRKPIQEAQILNTMHDSQTIVKWFDERSKRVVTRTQIFQ